MPAARAAAIAKTLNLVGIVVSVKQTRERRHAASPEVNSVQGSAFRERGAAASPRTPFWFSAASLFQYGHDGLDYERK
jgi:hypothetical protein